MTSPQPRPERVSAAHGGIQYEGELLRVAFWDDQFGEPLESDAYFRVVFLESTVAVPDSRIHDRRIAVYVPARRTASAGLAERQLRRAREALSDYPGEPGSRDALDGEAAEIEERVVREWSESFKNGQLVAAPALAIDLENIFGSGFWSAWTERIGVVLLARAYPEPAINASKLVGPLRPELDGPMLLDAAMGAASPVSEVAMVAFGPALGIASDDEPATFAPVGSALLDRVRALVEMGLEFAELGRTLAHGAGLTHSLATLATLLFLTRGTHRLRLYLAHTLRYRDGSLVDVGLVATGDLARLAWPVEFWGQPAAIEPVAESGGSSGIARALGTDGDSFDGWLAGMHDRVDRIANVLDDELTSFVGSMIKERLLA
jgi:hypothetical protein